MTENKKRQPYEAPVLTVVSFKVEQGFNASSQSLLGNFFLFNGWGRAEQDPWGGDLPAGSHSVGGWNDEGNSAW